MNTVRRGNLSVIKVIAALTEAGFEVSLPISEGLPYDIVVDRQSKLYRVQIKTAQWKNGCVVCHIRSNNGRWYKTGKSRFYKDTIDAFCCYSPYTKDCYWFEPNSVGTSAVYLRVSPPKNFNSKEVMRWAKDYKI